MCLIVGILAPIADRHNLITAEEGYFALNGTDSSSLDLLNVSPPLSNAVTINEVTATGWSATASTPFIGRQCYPFSGNATPIGSATMAGVTSCS